MTRKHVACVIFGAPRVLPENVLPTKADVMKAYLEIRQSLLAKTGNYPTFYEISHKLCYQVEQTWKQASIHTVSHERVIGIMRMCYDKYKTILKPYKSRKNKESYKRQLQIFCDDADTLFNVCKCKCFASAEMEFCNCEKQNKGNTISARSAWPQNDGCRMNRRRLNYKATK